MISVVSVCSQWSHVTITHDALDFIKQVSHLDLAPHSPPQIKPGSQNWRLDQIYSLQDAPQWWDLVVKKASTVGNRVLSTNLYFQVAKVLVDRSSDINIYDCLLLAISNESTEIAEGILEHSRWPTVQANCQGHLAPLNHKSSYPPDMTPLIMAAHRNCFAIVKQLLDMGVAIEKPHSPTYDRMLFCFSFFCDRPNHSSSKQKQILRSLVWFRWFVNLKLSLLH